MKQENFVKERFDEISSCKYVQHTRKYGLLRKIPPSVFNKVHGWRYKDQDYVKSLYVFVKSYYLP